MFAARAVLHNKTSASGPMTGVTYTQSSVYPGLSAATYAGMNDRSAINALETGVDTGTAIFVRADCGSTVFIDHIVVGYDYANSVGGGVWGAYYAEGLTVQGSTNGSSWTNIATTPTYASSGSTNGLVNITINGSWRYIRLYRGGDYIAITEFQLWATP